MRHHFAITTRFRVLTACSTALLTVATVFAQDESVLVDPQPAPPVLQPAQPAPLPEPTPLPLPGPVVTGESLPAPAIVETVVYPAPRVVYHTGLRARRMLRHHEPVDLMMVAKNPADGCLYEIPLCVPTCCEGEPMVRQRRGIFGRGVVEYCWPCGFTATVKFRLRGDVKVDYSA